MKLIIISQRVDINDDNLSFFHRILEKFSEKLEKVFSVCLWQGEYHLPQNVRVFSLGKEKGYSKIRQFFRLQKFLLKHLSEVDGIYCHMCPIYTIASFPMAKIFRKKLVLWYAHGEVNFKLRLAEKLVDAILTSSLDGCRIGSKKVKAIGQGIDVELFKPEDNSHQDGNFKILYAARLTPLKDHETLIKAIDILVNQKNIKNIKVRIIGRPLLDSQKEYLQCLKILVKNYGLQNQIEFLDGVSYLEMPKQFNWADLFVNPSQASSLEKVVLEAMACGCLVLNCNEAYREILPGKYLFKEKDPEDLAGKIINLMGAGKDRSLRETVVKGHNLDNLANRIIDAF